MIVLPKISKVGSERNPQFYACFETDPSVNVQDCFTSHEEPEFHQKALLASLSEMRGS